jgi:GT2 family glycosyltransferase
METSIDPAWPLISVIIPTYGREAVLCDTLHSVMAQQYPAYEVIVVDQSQQHEAATQALLDRLAAEAKIKLYTVSWASLPAARNYAVERANGSIFLFLDDDVDLPEGFLAAHAQVYQGRPEVGAVAGRVFDRMKLAEAGDLAIEMLPPEAMDPGIAWYHIDLVHTVKPQRVLTARGCNMSFRRSVFEQHGLRFDERFAGSAVREESDFCLRVRKTGLMIWYEPAAHLVHLGEETGGCHDISTRSLKYQTTFYHNHFLMALKNLTPWQVLRLSGRLFDCHVLGNPPCNKSGSPVKIVTRFGFYSLGFLKACLTLLSPTGRDGRLYSQPPSA